MQYYNSPPEDFKEEVREVAAAQQLALRIYYYYNEI